MYKTEELKVKIYTLNDLDVKCMNILCFSENLSAIELSKSYVDKTFPQFIEDIHHGGWKTDIVLLGADEWRVNTDSTGAVKKL